MVTLAMCYRFMFSVWAMVIGLLNSSGPSAVTRLIVPIIIGKAVKCFTCWTYTHVSQEVLKGKPAFTDSDTSATIV